MKLDARVRAVILDGWEEWFTGANTRCLHEVLADDGSGLAKACSLEFARPLLLQRVV